MTRVCGTLGILGDGAGEAVTTHGLRATMISLLIDAGYADSMIALRSGHRCLDNLKRYHNLRGDIGLEQISRIRSPDAKKLKIDPDASLPIERFAA